MINKHLEQELEYFKDNQEDLVKQHGGKFLVIKDKKIQGVYNSEIEAYIDAKAKFELGTFLIQKCLPGEESYTQTFHSRVSLF
ncbi:MAG: hypothetical protein V4486_01450 [Patescibacteria group bacterium]